MNNDNTFFLFTLKYNDLYCSFFFLIIEKEKKHWEMFEIAASTAICHPKYDENKK